MKFLSHASVVVILLLLGCDDKPESPYPQYPPLRVYLDRFKTEAAARGFDFDFTNVQIVYVDEIEVSDNVYRCGYGFSNYDGHGQRRIEISKAEPCGWLSKNDLERENLVFHELGHAFFNRTHDNTPLCDGSPASLMINVPTVSAYTVYTTIGDTRDYYIRELIDPLVANTKCIKDEKNWTNDSAFYKINKDDSEWILDTNNGRYIGSRSTAVEPDEYLSIASVPGVEAQANGYWFKAFGSPNIPECAEVKFKTKLNTESMTGIGASIGIRAYKNTVTKYGAQTEEYFVVSTEDEAVSGVLTDFPQSLTIPCYTRATTQFIIFAVLHDQTQGTVRFDDIEVLVKPK